MYINSVSTQIIGIVMLVFTIVLSLRNPVVDRRKTKLFIIVSALSVIMLLLEIIETYIISLKSINLIPCHKIILIMGFIITNLVTFLFLRLIDNSKFTKHKLLLLPLIINVIIIIATYWTGWIFYIDPQGEYFRGELFTVQLSINIFYYALMLIDIFMNYSNYDKDDVQFLSAIFVLPLIAITIQISQPQFYLIWVTVALSLMLHYIFLRELQFKFDLTSGIKNRSAFIKKLYQLNRNGKNTALVVLDLNDLKKTNDTNGHDKGDEAIYNAAQILQESFQEVGTPYRIGGDEFCVLCVNVTEKQVQDSLKKLVDLLEEYNSLNDIKITFAYGYDFYTDLKDGFKVFEIADKKMYEHKAKIKGIYGRRRDDQI